jgi:hypothetical protein
MLSYAGNSILRLLFPADARITHASKQSFNAVLILVQIFVIAETESAAVAVYEVAVLAFSLVGIFDDGLAHLPLLVLARLRGWHLRLTEFQRHLRLLSSDISREAGRMVVMQRFRERISDHPLIHGSGEQSLLRIPRKLRPDFQGRVSEQGDEPVLVHMQ